MQQEIMFWLVTTQHLEDGLWFPEEADFKTGMNYVAVLAAEGSVFVLAFILMSNHVHFVLQGTRDDVLWFINEFKRRYSKYLHAKYGIEKLLKDNDVDIRDLPLEDGSVERAIAYVQMNPVAANICTHPTQYPWGTGSVFFNAARVKGIRVDSLPARARWRILRSKTVVPGHWLISDDGYILPYSYVHYCDVEILYHTPKRMDFFLKASSKAQVRLESGESSMPAFNDQVVRSAIPDLCRTLYMKAAFDELSEPQKSEVLRQLRYRFSANIHQLARVVGVGYDEAARLLDTNL